MRESRVWVFENEVVFVGSGGAFSGVVARGYEREGFEEGDGSHWTGDE